MLVPNREAHSLNHLPLIISQFLQPPFPNFAWQHELLCSSTVPQATIFKLINLEVSFRYKPPTETQWRPRSTGRVDSQNPFIASDGNLVERDGSILLCTLPGGRCCNYGQLFAQCLFRFGSISHRAFLLVVMQESSEISELRLYGCRILRRNVAIMCRASFS